MADQLTLLRLKRRKRLKLGLLWTIGFALGLLLFHLTGFHSSELFPKGIKNLSAWAGIVSEQRLIDLFDWLGPACFLGGFFCSGYKVPYFKKLVDALFPDPPAFVRSDLEQARHRTMVHLERAPLPLVGRETELAQLAVLRTGNAATPFLWQSLTGPTGVGKTRLSIEWLETCLQRGWDVGQVDHGDLSAIGGWQARRPTALVIDDLLDTRLLGEALYNLAQGARVGAPVRVLVIGQTEPAFTFSEGVWRETVVQARLTDKPFWLDDLSNQTMEQLATKAGVDFAALGPALQAQLHNRPRKALIFFRAKPGTGHYIDAFRQWADWVFPELADSNRPLALDLALPLALAALAGPIPVEAAHQALGRNIDPLALARFFRPTDRHQLLQILPAPEPDDLYRELLLRILHRLDRVELQKLGAAALSANPEVMEQRLVALWRERTDLLHDGETAAASLSALRALQAQFDAQCPQRVDALRQEASALVDQTAQADDFATLEHLLQRLSLLVAGRPFDPAMRLAEAQSFVNAIVSYGTAKQFDHLERWGDCLITLAQHPNFAKDPQIRLKEAKAAVKAIHDYGVTKQFDHLERWGARLITLAQHPDFAKDPQIHLYEARGAVNAISCYGTAKQFDHLEQWGDRISSLAQHPDFAKDPQICQCEAGAGLNAITGYGAAMQFDHLERWGARLSALTQHPDLVQDPQIRLDEAKAAVNAIIAYGAAKQFDHMERWGARLVALAEHHDFAKDPQIRLHEAMAAVNVISQYGADKQFDHLERWGTRLSSLTQHPDFAQDPQIRLQEAMAAVNAISQYGADKQFDHLERWGTRLIALAQHSDFAKNPQIRLRETMAAFNAMNCYGNARQFGQLERWGARIITLTQHPDFSKDPQIRMVEARAAANALFYYAKEGDEQEAAYQHWLARLARVAMEFPGHAQIQQAAARYHVTYGEQMSMESNSPMDRFPLPLSPPKLGNEPTQLLPSPAPQQPTSSKEGNAHTAKSYSLAGQFALASDDADNPWR